MKMIYAMFFVFHEKGILLFYLNHAAAADNSWTRTIDRSAVRSAVATGNALVYNVIPTGFNVIWKLPRVRNSTAMFMPITPLGVANIGVQDVSSIVIENIYCYRANVGTLVRRNFPSPSLCQKNGRDQQWTSLIWLTCVCNGHFRTRFLLSGILW